MKLCIEIFFANKISIIGKVALKWKTLNPFFFVGPFGSAFL